MRVIVIRHVPVDAEIAHEVAGLLGSAVHLVPAAAAGAVVVVPDGPTATVTPWPGRMRPVVDLTRSDDGSVHLDVFASRPGAGQGVRGRLLASALPTHGLAWQADVPAGTDPDRPAPEHVRDVVAALSLDPDQASLLDRLLRSPDVPPRASDLATALGLPPEVAPLLEGQVRAGDLPGMIGAERLGAWGTIRESLLARPEGTSVVARMRRWDHDRPALSVLAILVAVALAGAALVYPFPGDHLLADGWPRVAWLVAAGVLAVDAIGSAVVLVAVRRRRRRARRD